MPILNIQLGGQGQAEDGRKVVIPPQTVLLSRGPIVQVNVSIGQAIAQEIVQKGGTLPPPVSGLALIDTGASSTCIDNAAAKKLKLPAIDVVAIASASHSQTEQNVYPITLEIAGLPIMINAPRAIGGALESQGLLVLIGRDVLQHCVLVYNGVSGGFSISI